MNLLSRLAKLRVYLFCGRMVNVVGLRPLVFGDFGFESRLGHGYLSVVSVGCCQVEVSATN